MFARMYRREHCIECCAQRDHFSAFDFNDVALGFEERLIEGTRLQTSSLLRSVNGGTKRRTVLTTEGILPQNGDKIHER